MKQINLLFMLVLSIGLIVSIGFAGPGPVSEPDFHAPFFTGDMPGERSQEVVSGFTIQPISPDGTIVSIDYGFTYTMAEDIRRLVAEDKTFSSGQLNRIIRSGGYGQRVPERRSWGNRDL
ncbi:hypothetical protein HQ531_02495 [bacterium]|nr:hypothetical protein [bacterium]